MFFGISSLIFPDTSKLGILLLPPCFAGLFLSLSLLVCQTLSQLKHLYQGDGIGIFDKVTRVHNRYYLEQRLDAEVARSHRYNTPLALVAVDLVDFDILNDEYGHQAGDIAVTRVAETLKKQLRETDIVARYYPNCFLLILPDTPERNVHALVNRLEDVLNGLVVIEGTDSEKSLCVSVRFGLSTCTLSTVNAGEMITKSLQLPAFGNRISVGRPPSNVENKFPEMT